VPPHTISRTITGTPSPPPTPRGGGKDPLLPATSDGAVSAGRGSGEEEHGAHGDADVGVAEGAEVDDLVQQHRLARREGVPHRVVGGGPASLQAGSARWLADPILAPRSQLVAG